MLDKILQNGYSATLKIFTGTEMPMQSPKPEAHVCHLVLGLPLGGTEGLVAQMLRHPASGFTASVICLDEIGVLGEAALKEGKQVQLIRRGPGINLAVPRAIARYARLNHVRILHCHHYTPWFYGSLARLFCPKLRIIFTEHGRLYPDPESFKRRLFNQFILPITDCITAVSPAVAQALTRVEGIPLKRIKVVYNGVDGKKFAELLGKEELRTRFGLRQDCLYFILCSRLDPIKWIEGLLLALKRVVEANPQVGLIIVGDGQEKARIRNQTNELGLQAHVVMPGYRADVPEWLAAADIFVLSSLSEGTSVSLIESMAVGIPSVVTRVGGNEYVVEDGVTGLIVAPQDVAALANGMDQLASDDALRRKLGQAAQAQFRSRFEVIRMFESYEKIYRALMDPRNAHESLS
jgi:L-malate glycosyltransferase